MRLGMIDLDAVQFGLPESHGDYFDEILMPVEIPCGECDRLEATGCPFCESTGFRTAYAPIVQAEAAMLAKTDSLPVWVDCAEANIL